MIRRRIVMKCRLAVVTAFTCFAVATPGIQAQVEVDWVAPVRGVAVAVDSASNVYTLDYEYALGAEMLLVKHDVDGQFVWQARYDQTDDTKWERAAWIVVDHDDNIVVCGTLMSGYSNPVAAASIAMKFASNGALLWRNVYESSFDGSSVSRCLVDELNNVYVVGLGVGPPGLVTKVKKFDAAGTPVWSYFDAAGIGAPINAKLAPEGGALIIAGRGTVGSVNGYAKVGFDGTERWSLPGIASLTVGDAAGDSQGNTFVVHGEYVTGGGTVVKKLDSAGALLWQSVYPSTGFRVEVGSDDRAVVAGFPSSGTGGAAFFKVDESGGLVWSNLDADGPLALLLHAHLILDARNNAYLAAGTLFAMAVCKVNHDGSSGWTATVPGGNSRAIALSPAGESVFVVGGSTARLLQDASQAFVRGDCNSDGAFNLADAVFALGFLFAGATSVPCDDACDGNDDGNLDISDPVTSLNTLFGGGPPLPQPAVSCAPDPTPDALTCAAFPNCP